MHVGGVCLLCGMCICVGACVGCVCVHLYVRCVLVVCMCVCVGCVLVCVHGFAWCVYSIEDRICEYHAGGHKLKACGEYSHQQPVFILELSTNFKNQETMHLSPLNSKFPENCVQHFGKLV